MWIPLILVHFLLIAVTITGTMLLSAAVASPCRFKASRLQTAMVSVSQLGFLSYLSLIGAPAGVACRSVSDQASSGCLYALNLGYDYNNNNE